MFLINSTWKSLKSVREWICCESICERTEKYAQNIWIWKVWIVFCSVTLQSKFTDDQAPIMGPRTSDSLDSHSSQKVQREIINFFQIHAPVLNLYTSTFFLHSYVNSVGLCVNSVKIWCSSWSYPLPSQRKKLYFH